MDDRETTEGAEVLQNLMDDEARIVAEQAKVYRQMAGTYMRLAENAEKRAEVLRVWAVNVSRTELRGNR